MSSDGTLGSLLQGVSQQPPAVRPEGKVTDQVNFTSDVVQGLTSRPALVERATLPAGIQDGLSFMHAELSGTLYLIGFKAGVFRMWDTAGVEQTVTPQDANALAYIGPNMRPYVSDGTLFLANRDTVVAKAAAADGGLGKFGVVYCLGGKYSRTYEIRLCYSDNGAIAYGSFTTPDGSATGHAAQTSGDYIMQALMSSLTGHALWRGGSTFSSRVGAYVWFFSNAADFTITVSDGEDNDTIRAVKDYVDDVSHLPVYSGHGHLVKVGGDDSGSADDYWMRFKSNTTSTPIQGFGLDGVWEEWYNHNEVSAFDLKTMPHVVVKTGPTTFSLSRGAWLGRRVGDNNTNAFPDFVGRTIRDIGGFQSRLVVVSGPYCCMSRTNKPLDFFKQTALAELDSDPVSVTSTSEGTVKLDWIIPFDRDLVLMSDPGAGQYIITGSNKLTSGNASLVKTTAFEMRGGAKPVETGRTVMFPYKSGIYSGIKEFFTNDQVATNGADTITEAVDRYITGLVDHMQCSTNFNMAVFKTGDEAQSKTVWVYKYLWQNTEKLQSAWSRWVFPLKVHYFFFTGSELFVVMSDTGLTGGTRRYVFAALDLDIPIDPLAEYHICLDRQMARTADSLSKVTLPYANARFVQGTGCADPGREANVLNQTAPDAAGLVTYSLEPGTVPPGASVLCGLRYARWVKPTMPFIRDRNGSPAPRSRLVVNSFMVEYENTGYIKSILTSKYRKDPIEFVMDWFPLDSETDDALGNGLRSGILNVPWGERADWSEFTIYSDDIRPTTIIEIEWTGEGFKGSRE